MDCNLSQFGIVTHLGRRCSVQHHCVYPPYRRHNFLRKEDLILSKCQDGSDLVHKINTTCDKEVLSLLGDYCNIFCNNASELLDELEIDGSITKSPKFFINSDGKKLARGVNCDQKCSNKEQWLSQQTDPVLLDPNNCQDSCINKSSNCTACTHPDYSFQCKINGTQHCYHKTLRCDQHPLCDAAEDEIGEDCERKQVKKKPEASLKCKSPFYPKSAMDILAVACNTEKECSDGGDESSLCSTNLSLYGTLIAIFTIFLTSLIYKFYHWRKIGTDINWRYLLCLDLQLMKKKRRK